MERRKEMGVTLQQAQKAIETAVAKSQSLGLRMAIAVVDERADLVALVRMDGVRAFAPDVARGKAMASALWGQPSAALAERATSSVFQVVSTLHGGRVVYGQGAVPLMRGTELLGSIGVSGARPEQDEEVAKAGAAALAS
jgi:glc operon protein GlcG